MISAMSFPVGYALNNTVSLVLNNNMANLMSTSGMVSLASTYAWPATRKTIIETEVPFQVLDVLAIHTSIEHQPITWIHHVDQTKAPLITNTASQTVSGKLITTTLTTAYDTQAVNTTLIITNSYPMRTTTWKDPLKTSTLPFQTKYTTYTTTETGPISTSTLLTSWTSSRSNMPVSTLTVADKFGNRQDSLSYEDVHMELYRPFSTSTAMGPNNTFVAVVPVDAKAGGLTHKERAWLSLATVFAVLTLILLIVLIVLVCCCYKRHHRNKIHPSSQFVPANQVVRQRVDDLEQGPVYPRSATTLHPAPQETTMLSPRPEDVHVVRADPVAEPAEEVLH
jgi:hypothetical protein